MTAVAVRPLRATLPIPGGGARPGAHPEEARPSDCPLSLLDSRECVPFTSTLPQSAREWPAQGRTASVTRGGVALLVALVCVPPAALPGDPGSLVHVGTQLWLLLQPYGGRAADRESAGIGGNGADRGQAGGCRSVAHDRWPL